MKVFGGLGPFFSCGARNYIGVAGVFVRLWRMHLNWKIEFPDRLPFSFLDSIRSANARFFLGGPPYCGAGKS